LVTAAENAPASSTTPENVTVPPEAAESVTPLAAVLPRMMLPLNVELSAVFPPIVAVPAPALKT